MAIKTFKVGDLNKFIMESANEFKPKMGSNVESENKKNNDKSYKEATKRAKDYDGGLTKEVGEEKPNYEKIDGNKTTLSYNINNASKEYIDRVKAQVGGYTSELEKENGIEKTGDFSDNDKIYDAIKDNAQDIHDYERYDKERGLTGNKMPKGTFEKPDMFSPSNAKKDNEEKKDKMEKKSQNESKIKTVIFKKTEFLTEGHMISRIPDEFKNEGTTFKMKDKTGNEYLVEWSDNRANIIDHKNKKGLVESVNRMRELFNYKPADNVQVSTSSARLNENNNYRGFVDKVRDTSNTKKEM